MHLISFEHETGQPSRGVGAGIDIDPVGVDVGFNNRRVPMHDQFLEWMFVKKKIFADPQQIVLTLTGKSSAGPHSSMDEEVVPQGERQLQLVEEKSMSRR